MHSSNDRGYGTQSSESAESRPEESTCVNIKRLYSRSIKHTFEESGKIESSKLKLYLFNGWLLSCRPHSYNSVGLLNPLSGSYVPLPPSFNIIKVVASGSPLDPSCVVLAITGSQTLEFCNLCEGTWRKIENEIYGCSDIVYCDNKFYVLDGIGEVLLYYLRSKLKVISPCNDCKWDKLLLELSRNLLQVTRRESKSLFEVLKLDFNAQSWIAVTSLEDHSLLWTDNQGLSVSSKDFPQFKSDCIYFMDRGGCIMRAFDLKSKRCGIVHKLSGTLPLRYLWFTPDVTIRSNTR